MDLLWAGWRSEYVRSVDDAPGPCLFCRLPDEPDEESLILERGDLAFSVLNRFPYSTGHLMVSQYRHAGGLGDLTEAEQAEIWRLLDRARDKGLNIDLQSAQFLAERTEGNLLAADQELEKLSIRFAQQSEIDFETIAASVAESSGGSEVSPAVLVSEPAW